MNAAHDGGGSGPSSALELPNPYLLFLGDTTEPAYAKTAFGLRDWAPERCIGEWGCDTATVSTGLPRLAPKEARVRGARGLVIGIANTGGVIGESWVPLLVEALEAGLDIVSGLHVKLDSVPALKAAAQRCGRRLIDIRTPPPNIPCGTGSKRPGKRLLTVGTDCALGKKYSALAIARAFKASARALSETVSGEARPPMQACLVAPQLVVACMVTRQAAVASAFSGKAARVTVLRVAARAAPPFMVTGSSAYMARAIRAAPASSATAALVPGYLARAGAVTQSTAHRPTAPRRRPHARSTLGNDNC
jgi:hypothetical protein